MRPLDYKPGDRLDLTITGATVVSVMAGAIVISVPTSRNAVLLTNGQLKSARIERARPRNT